MTLITPVLLIAFRRPKLTQQVFHQIRCARPAKLYIAIDGPKSESDKILIEEVIQIIDVDWECEVVWKINSENQGCRVAVSDAISWFFSHENEGIVLEDDCLPDPTFFTYCEKMLNEYRNDEAVGHISGSNFLNSQADGSYYFTKYPHVWGWASWARVWNLYDRDLINYRELDYYSISDNVFERLYWFEKFENCSKFKIDTWDYQYVYSLWKNGLKSINPHQNLVSNIGFASKPTHWNIKNYDVANFPRGPIHNIIPPVHTETKNFDSQIFRKSFNRYFVSNVYRSLKFILKNGFFNPVIFKKPSGRSAILVPSSIHRKSA